MKDLRSIEEINYAVECRHVSLLVHRVIDAVEGPEDLETAYAMYDEIQNSFPRNEKRDNMFDGVKELTRKVALKIS